MVIQINIKLLVVVVIVTSMGLHGKSLTSGHDFRHRSDALTTELRLVSFHESHTTIEANDML